MNFKNCHLTRWIRPDLTTFLESDGSFVCFFSLRLQYYWLFVLSRGLVGIGESSYSSISPTIIGDLFTNNSRTTMLSIFYLAIPLGRWDFQTPSPSC